MLFPPAFFITGTDTNVGKTVVSAILTSGLQGTYWKPIQSGFPKDTDWVKQVSELPDNHFVPEQFVLSRPLSPHLSAKLDGLHISLKDFALPAAKSPLIIEGAGGIMVPINEKDYVIDIIKQLNLPVILVARSTLGTINHTLLSLEKLRNAKINVLGIVMNGPKNNDNREALEHYGKISVLAEIEPIKIFDRETLIHIFQNEFQKNNVKQPC